MVAALVVCACLKVSSNSFNMRDSALYPLLIVKPILWARYLPQFGQVPPCGVKDRHPVDVAQAATDCVSETSGRASCFAATPGVK